MQTFDILDKASKVFTINGTPENFLTALRYKIWGFNSNNKLHWEKNIRTGQILFFHSKQESMLWYREKPPARIIGFGIVGDISKRVYNKTPLWIDEIQNNKSYPYRFPFSRIFLYTDIPLNDDWDSTSRNKGYATYSILQKLLDGGTELPERFPSQASFSPVNDPNTRWELEYYANKLYNQGDGRWY